MCDSNTGVIITNSGEDRKLQLIRNCMKEDALIWYEYINNTPNTTTEECPSTLMFEEMPNYPWRRCHLFRRSHPVR